MSKSAIIGLVVTAGVIALIAWSVRGVNTVTCEVCITWQDKTICRTGQGRTEMDAQQTAAQSACAVLPTNGMAERIKCADSTPTSLDCK